MTGKRRTPRRPRLPCYVRIGMPPWSRGVQQVRRLPGPVVRNGEGRRPRTGIGRVIAGTDSECEWVIHRRGGDVNVLRPLPHSD